MKRYLFRVSLADFSSALFMGAIALAAWLTGCDLLMFPELGALSNDIFRRPRGVWASAPVMLVVTPLITAVIGLLITNHMNFGVAAVLLDVVISMSIIELIQSPIAPGISAGLLPLVLGIHRWTYPLAITVGTVALAAISVVHRRFLPPASPPTTQDKVNDVMEKAAPKPLWLLPYLLLLTGLSLLAQVDGFRLLLFPPLVVTGFEMFAHPLVCPWALRAWHLPVACTVSAIAGVGLVTLLGAGVAAAFLSMLASVAVLRIIDLYAPPVLAIGLLPMVLPHPSYRFAALVFASTLILTVSFRAWRTLHLRLARSYPALFTE